MSSDFNNILAQAKKLKYDMQSMDDQLQSKFFEACIDGIYCRMTGHGKIDELSLNSEAQAQSPQQILPSIIQVIHQLQEQIEADKQATFIKMTQDLHASSNT